MTEALDYAQPRHRMREFTPQPTGPRHCIAQPEDEASHEAAKVSLAKLEAELTRDRIEDIARLMRKLTYGEMMELAQGIWKVHDSQSDHLTAENLPAILHRWSKDST